MVSFVMGSRAVMLSALLVLATLAHIVWSRLRGVSTLKSQRRQFLPRKRALETPPSMLLMPPGPQESQTLRTFAGDWQSGDLRALTHAVLPPLEMLGLSTVVRMICVATTERRRTRRSHLMQRGIHGGYEEAGDALPRRLSVKFLPNDRPKRIAFPDSPVEHARDASRLRSGTGDGPAPLLDVGPPLVEDEGKGYGWQL
jgi:hypothetical protein